MRDAEQNRRREELQRRIEETRMKLQNVSPDVSRRKGRVEFISKLQQDYYSMRNGGENLI